MLLKINQRICIWNNYSQWFTSILQHSKFSNERYASQILIHLIIRKVCAIEMLSYMFFFHGHNRSFEPCIGCPDFPSFFILERIDSNRWIFILPIIIWRKNQYSFPPFGNHYFIAFRFAEGGKILFVVRLVDLAQAVYLETDLFFRQRKRGRGDLSKNNLDIPKSS